MHDVNLARPTWAEVNLKKLAENFRLAKEFVGPSYKYMAVVKADAYGHGALECSRRLAAAGADWFGVAIPEEGAELRRGGISKLILCLGGFWPGQEELLLNCRLTPVIFQIDRAARLNAAAERRGTVAAIHVKIDTGMNRIGVRFNEAGEFAGELASFSHLRVEGLMTHFAAADDLAQNEFYELQKKRFASAIEAFRAHGHYPSYFDLANSPGAIAHKDVGGNMVRLGGVLYGLGDDILPRGISRPTFHPIMSVHTRIAFIKRVLTGETIGYGRTFKAEKEMRVATLPIGYQDGFHRVLSNCGKVIIAGKYAPVVGRVSMDWTVVDVSSIPQAAEGDEVAIIGRMAGLEITAEDLAALSGTISYEITCGISRRVPRQHVD